VAFHQVGDQRLPRGQSAASVAPNTIATTMMAAKLA